MPFFVSGIWILDSGLQSLVGFRIPPSCIPDFKVWDSRLHNQNFPVFRIWIPREEISGISDSLYMGRYFQVPTIVTEYGPNTAGEIARPKTTVVEQA